MADELIKATVAQQPYAMGYEVVKAAYAAIQGQKVDAVISAPVKVVTKENGQEYLDSL
jgi:ribose transport system substrate-binding protein